MVRVSGAAGPDGKGGDLSITSAKTGIGSWSEAKIAAYLATSFTPYYDSVGGAMIELQADMAKLTDADRATIAAYLKAVRLILAAPPYVCFAKSRHLLKRLSVLVKWRA